MSLRATLAASVALAVIGICPAEASASDHPFVGKWDCTVATFVLTPETWDVGGEVSKIEGIRKIDDDLWKLSFADDYVLSLFGFAEDGGKMEFLSSASGDSYPCKRLAN